MVRTPGSQLSVPFSDFITIYAILLGFLCEIFLQGDVKSTGTVPVKVKSIERIVYTREDLLVRKTSCGMPNRINSSLYEHIKTLGIKRRFRLHRSKIRKIKPKEWNKGVHHCLLRPLRKRLINYSIDKNLNIGVINTQSI